MLQQYGTIGLFFIAAIIFGFAALAVSWLLRAKPSRSSRQKYEAYECGMPTIGPTWIQFKLNYFTLALVFLVFDVETIFLYPWAVTFRELGLFVFVEMFIFLTILLIGFWYAWKERAFDWK